MRDIQRIAHEATKPIFIKSSPDELKTAARRILEDLYESGPSGKEGVVETLDRWVDFLRGRSRVEEASEVESFKDVLEIPF
jgi:hypothetical protein